MKHLLLLYQYNHLIYHYLKLYILNYLIHLILYVLLFSLDELVISLQQLDLPYTLKISFVSIVAT